MVVFGGSDFRGFMVLWFGFVGLLLGIKVGVLGISEICWFKWFVCLGLGVWYLVLRVVYCDLRVWDLPCLDWCFEFGILRFEFFMCWLLNLGFGFDD